MAGLAMPRLAMPRRMRRACTTQHMMPLFISLRTGDAEHHRTIAEAPGSTAFDRARLIKPIAL